MFLKQIEIHGFKSFANDTILKFEKGINGIVGPNGSGKSNIADAVRWVLGERSMKQLRGAETMDVIFSGTELRKAQGFAYVNLIIDNEMVTSLNLGNIPRHSVRLVGHISNSQEEVKRSYREIGSADSIEAENLHSHIIQR